MYSPFTFWSTHAYVRWASDVGVVVVLQLAMKLVQLGMVATCTALVPVVDEPRCAHVGLDRASFRWLVATTWVATLLTLVATAVMFAFARLGRMTPDKRQRCSALPPRPTLLNLPGRLCFVSNTSLGSTPAFRPYLIDS
jgi:hypothetical protein